ncbi:Stk1 family PASTA domain-containing Ser/Thr kinase [Paenibacillus sp. TRM 82003]|uniref:Stk1 family PASTA domain-containing Ser/Thr kinase n=1 Tax=Kineococcus sp. TRM81007 TaxID=2925831 RepID=UPI001F580297|nr:Stk1 family PASTA domain-containing Ser/Thr kinase [Kineococcus sp. TRM81007]MCI2239674.1 Stk1 family PASTA domain-containing Ser/Thr kinase [Kineococcus sp. TRM81007]MCI3926763.1 Stk1 family PASTA domain-containing Ser/Thr kinase [Paenibacillus sp. TRM 82003]
MDATLSDPLVGRVLDRRYRVLGRIGRGGMGVVYRAEDQRLDREVALKVLRADLAHDPVARQRFVREAKSAARLAHPGVVAVLDQGVDDGAERGDGQETAYLVMELVNGRTLRDVVHEEGALALGEALDVTAAVLDALAEAHRKGLLHRDVKTGNVLVGDDGRVKVGDFGLARSAAPTQASTASTGADLLGTAEYLAPEQVSRGIADARSDVYGVGVLLFEVLTGAPPFTGDTPIRVAYQHVYDDPPAPSSLVPGLPAAVDRLVLGALAKDPDERPRDAGEMLTGVRRVRAELTGEELAVRSSRPAAGGAGSTVRLDLAAAPAAPLAGARGHGDADGDGDANGDGDADGTGADGAGAPVVARPGRRRGRRGVLVMVLTLAVLAVAAGISWWFMAGPGAFTTTPDVAGRTPAAAAQQLRSAGFQVDEREEFSDTVPEGTVIGTDPGAGERVREEGTVTLVVSRGVQHFDVPDVAGRETAAAEQALRETDLAVGAIAEEFSEDVEQGRVVRTDPAAGTSVPHDTPVGLVVSKGRQPIAVPDVAGQPLEEARARIAEAGLVAGEPTERTSETVPAGRVVSQEPAEGTLFRGDTVELVVSTGPPLVEVPGGLQGKQLPEVRAALEELGFTVRVEEVLGGIFGTVRSVEPGSGQAVPKGSTITVTVV